ncbi:phosphoribosylamine--glycine ligase [Arcanobacterium ihumii]|uniref:phosphoribosylamine--glycine ligase n=1 Tax=Arcanobacterium ihumii TaxID=2138162 RepID=UPI000F533C97|nr:phosphoribosylamine--glycine ligase [Arcanobacterium ihumii]
MKVMVVGGGGREMALVTAIAKYHNVIVAGGSEAIDQIADEVLSISRESPWEKLADEAIAHGVVLTIVGPETPLASGIVDVFRERGLVIFGPTKAAASIESSKAFAKQIMTEAGVPTAAYQVFTKREDAQAYLETVSYPQVLKENGLRSGKGVTICPDLQAARIVVDSIVIDHENPLLIEDFLDGFEYSLIVMVNGENFVALPVAQDHKPIGEGNTGPNTGGMGAVSPVPRVTPEIYNEAIDQVIKPTLAQMVTSGTPFTGFLYAGLIQTAKGVRVIEFNARLGDPECEVILPRIKSDIASVALHLLKGEAAEVSIDDSVCLGVVLSSPGYPGVITSSPALPKVLIDRVVQSPNASIIHMGTHFDFDAGTWVAAGGRVAIVTMKGNDIDECRRELLPLLEEALSGSDLYWRKDIGTFAG